MVRSPPGGPKLVGRPPWRSGTGRETHPEVSKWSGDRPGGLKVVGRHSRRFGSGRETLTEVRK